MNNFVTVLLVLLRNHSVFTPIPQGKKIEIMHDKACSIYNLPAAFKSAMVFFSELSLGSKSTNQG